MALLFFLWQGITKAATNIYNCGELDTVNETYILQNDIPSDKTCFAIRNNGITLDLNGYTVTYGNFSSPTVTKGDFENGSSASPDNWDLANAPEAERFADSYVQPVELYSGSYGINYNFTASAQYVLSSANVNLTANNTS